MYVSCESDCLRFIPFHFTDSNLGFSIWIWFHSRFITFSSMPIPQTCFISFKEDKALLDGWGILWEIYGCYVMVNGDVMGLVQLSNNSRQGAELSG